MSEFPGLLGGRVDPKGVANGANALGLRLINRDHEHSRGSPETWEKSSSSETPKAPVPNTTAGRSTSAEDACKECLQVSASPTPGAVAELPKHLLRVPGLVGELADWMGRTAHRPLPAANLLTALAVVATTAGRRFGGPTDSGLAVYGLALAPSGSGKAHPIRAAHYVMGKAGIGHMVAPSAWMSGSALIQHLARQPASISFADEVGEFFARLNGAKASTHERAISGILREIFAINWGSYICPGWARSNAASVPPVIHAPAYSFIGYSVPDAVWDAMQGADITNGMLNRFFWFQRSRRSTSKMIQSPCSMFRIA